MSIVLAALGLMLVIEGVLPLLAPRVWREAFQRILQFSDGQIRSLGLGSILAGLALFVLGRA